MHVCNFFQFKHEYRTSNFNCIKNIFKKSADFFFLCLMFVDYMSFSQANGICIVHSDVSSDIKLLYLPKTIQLIVWLLVFKFVYNNVIVWPDVSNLNTPLSSSSVVPVKNNPGWSYKRWIIDLLGEWSNYISELLI